MIALVPARGGSKGLPGKNLKEFNGVPLVGLAIQDAMQAESVTEVYISTDDPVIEEIAKSYGAKSLGLRPDFLASDNSLANDTFRYTLDQICLSRKAEISELIIIQPTSPLRLPEDIDLSVELFLSNSADSVISCTVQSNPISWYKSIDSNYRILSTINKVGFSNRQDEEILYIPNGAVYILSSSIIYSDSWYSNNTFAHIMPKERSIDVDDIFDFDFAVYMSKKLGIKNSTNK